MSQFLGARLRQLRRAHGLRVRDLAAALAVSPAQLSRGERGRGDAAGDEFIHRVAAQFGDASEDELLLLAGRLPADLQAILQQHPAESALLLREHFGTPRVAEVASRAAAVPPELIAALVEWAVRADTDVVLDPSCGDGALLVAAGTRLIALGAKPSAVADQLHGYDADTEACARTVRRLRQVTGVASRLIRCQNFLRAESRSRLPFHRAGAPAVTAVIGAMTSDGRAATAAVRRQARAVAAEAGIELPDTAAPWAALIVHAASCVRAGGRVALLVPSALLHAQYAGAVRGYLAQLFPSLTVVTFERPLPGVGEAVVLFGDAAGPAGVRALRARDATDLTAARLSEAAPDHVAEPAMSLPSRWSGASLPTPGQSVLRSLQQQGVLRRLGDLVEITPGIVTGANRFFVLSAAMAQAIPQEYLRPVLATTRDAAGVIFQRDDWERMRDGGRSCYLLAISNDARLDSTMQAYLQQGERDGVPDHPTCRRRPRWYCLPIAEAPAAVLTYLCRRRPRMLLNQAGVSHVNALHSVQPRRGVNMAAATVAFLSTAALLGCELRGRHYGAGALQLEPTEAAEILVPYPRADDCERIAALLPELDTLWRAGREEDVVTMVDEQLLRNRFQIDAATLRELHRCYVAERDRRRAR